MRISWQQFENTCQNTQKDFEDLCRVFFKYHIVRNKDANLPQKINNAGIETDPIMINGKRIGFQAKYFSNKISYIDILDSAEKTIKYYLGKVDKIILFSNKNISSSAKDYVSSKKLLNDNDIELEPFCDANILDAIDINDEYAPIKALFFDKLNLSTKWFDDKLRCELKDLEPRYISGFHIPADIEKYFEIEYRSDAMFQMLNGLIKTWKSDLKEIYDAPDDIKQEILLKLNQIIIPTRSNLEEIFKWHIPFEPIHNRVNLLYTEKYARWMQIINGEIKLDKDETEKVRREYNVYDQINSILSSTDLSTHEYFQYINNNILIIEGDAGTGKSHILGYEADIHRNNKNYRSILLLGQKLISDDDPSTQIMKALGLTDRSFKDFLDSCEAKGEATGCITVFLFDAINECAHHNIWKYYLNQILQIVKEYHHVRFIFSIRSTYKNVIFNEALQNDINTRKIPLVIHSGFRNILSIAVPAFFNHYSIPISAAAFFDMEFENPLFLRIYCECYINGMKHGSRSMFSLYQSYVLKEEAKIKESLGIFDSFSYCNAILNKLGECFFKTRKNHIIYDDLLHEIKDLPHYSDFIDRMLKAKILLSYTDDKNCERVYMSYERFADFIIAENIISNTHNIDEVKHYIETELFLTNEYGYFILPNAISLFAVISVRAREKYHEEIINCIDAIKENEDSFYIKNDLISEYIDSYKMRADPDIDAITYLDMVYPHIKTKQNFEKHLELMLIMAGRENTLNANLLTKWLLSLSLSKRDYIWTIYINDNYYEGERIYNIIQNFINNDLCYITYQDRILYGQELAWFLTSSNRILRDKSSRALIRLIGDDLKSAIELLKIFIEVNDPYVISRLFGCVYGALLRIDLNKIDLNDLYSLATWIYNDVFNKNEVYPDILLRDYALNIIKYAEYLDIKLCFDILQCVPPYKSREIKQISVEKLKEEYPEHNYEKDSQRLGTDCIKLSLAPEYGIKGFCGGYGDFGRYTFDSQLYYFNGVKSEFVFSYAFDYIITALGYDNKLFSKYDHRIGTGRGRYYKHLERIGKKYQWIAMHHTLALVSDHYKYEEKYSDISFNSYKGSWRPNVRDFDPTLSLTKTDRTYKIPFTITQPIYNDWDIENACWVEKRDDGNEFKPYAEIKDSKECIWIMLHGHIIHKSKEGYDCDYRELWKMISAYCISEKEYDNFIEKIKNSAFWGRWFPEANSRYNLFSKEYHWSPAYNDEYIDNSFEEIEIDTEKKQIVKQQMPILFNDDFAEIRDEGSDNNPNGVSLSFTMEERDMEIPIKEKIGKVHPCWEEFSWGKGYDYSKEESIRYDLPCGSICNQLKMRQILDGIWAIDNDIVAFDSSLIKGNNEGLYIRKDILFKYLKNNKLKLFWIGIGERNDCKKDSEFRSGESKYKDLSSLMYYDEDGNLTSVDKLGERM